MRLKGLTAIVTGGGYGFGEGISRAFSAEGAKVVVADINNENGERVASELRAAGGDAIFCPVDVSKSSDMKALADRAVKQYRRIDIVVNNAGICHDSQPMLDVSEELFDRVFQVNVKSIYLSAIHFVPVFRKQGGGCIVNIASTAGVRPRPGLTWYNGSKGAVITLTKSMAIELAPDKIRVNAINPVAGDTGMLKNVIGKSDSPEVRVKFAATIPLGRFSRPADIANAALFFADPASELVTGACLEVDGGRCV